VLCDRYPDDDTERSGKIKRDHREFVVADATSLPFDNKSFDFIYCSHVAEHIEDIAAFFQELQRVGKAGYIETPNYLFEQAIGTTTHTWALYIDNGTLVAQRKTYPGAAEKVYHGWHRTLARHPILQACFIGLPELRVMQFWWRDTISFRIEDAPPFLTATKSKD
jgi:SAM-dependent methyltransferase